MIALYDAAEQSLRRALTSPIQNAGIITIARIEAMTEKEWDTVIAGQHEGCISLLSGGHRHECASTSAAAA